MTDNTHTNNDSEQPTQAYPQYPAQPQPVQPQPQPVQPNPYITQPQSAPYASQRYGYVQQPYPPQAYGPGQPGVSGQSGKSHKGLLIGGIIAACVAVIALIVVVILFATGTIGSQQGSAVGGNNSSFSAPLSPTAKKLQQYADDCEQALDDKYPVEDIESIVCKVEGETLVVTAEFDENPFELFGAGDFGDLFNFDSIAKMVAGGIWGEIHDDTDLDNFKVKLVIKADGKTLAQGTVEDDTSFKQLEDYADSFNSNLNDYYDADGDRSA